MRVLRLREPVPILALFCVIMVQSCVIMYYPPADAINLTNRLRAHFKSLDSLYILYSLTIHKPAPASLSLRNPYFLSLV